MYLAALLARTEDGWEASDTELDDVETLSDLTDLAREASVDEDTVLVYIEQEDAWFGVVFASAYLSLRSHCGALAGWRGGVIYGAGVFLVGALPAYLLAFASFRVSPEVVGCWLAQAFCQYVVAGAAVGAVAGRS